MMFSDSISAAALLSMLAFSVNGHMVITSPVPYGQSSLTNSPLINDGSDFPCKQRSGVYDITTMNQMPVGVPQTLSFKGGATHGGGSCQVSITLDKQPDKDSQWKVVHSIVGGCPANATGNLSEDADGTNAAVFNFEVPKGFPNGEYSLAWTWFNKIGNREMYMNCAPITVTGGGTDTKVFDALPDMFVINIPNEECATVEGEDFEFPSPGESAETGVGAAPGSKTVGSGCASVTNKGAGSGKAAAVTTAAGGQSSGYSSVGVAASSPVPSSTVSGDALVTLTTMATVAGSSVPDPTTAASTYAVPATSASYPSPSGTASGSNSGSSSGSSGACSNGSQSCTVPGAVVCIGTTQFGLCDTNMCAVPQALADGTVCSGGVIARRDRHVRRHIVGRRSY